MPSDKIQRLAVAIKGLERKIAAAHDEIARKYPHVRGTCCQSCYYGGPNSTRITVNTPGFDIVQVKKLPDTTPAAVSDGLADYSIDSLPRGQWKQLKDRWQDADR